MKPQNESVGENMMVRMEYVGTIPELQGQTALVMPARGESFLNLKVEDVVLAQFDDLSLIFNCQRLGYRWTPFMRRDFRPIGAKPVF